MISITNLGGDPGLEHGSDAADDRLVIPARRLHLEPGMAFRLLCSRSFVAGGRRGGGGKREREERLQ